MVHADSNKIMAFDSVLIEEFSVKHPAWKIIKEAQKNSKESGVNTLCLAEGYLIHGDAASPLRSPLFLTPVRYKIDKVRSQLHLELAEDDKFVNPYVEHVLQTNDLHVKLNIDTAVNVLMEAGFTVDLESSSSLGNFHHHRYAILRELEDLLEQESFSIPLASILEDGSYESSYLALPPDLLLPADTDHLQVLQQADSHSTVIQGPPGTGKSQVLTNLLGKLLAANKSSVILSEKRVALEVLIQKLSDFGLDRLGFVVTSDNSSKELLRHLESNWQFFELESFERKPNLRLSEQYMSQLQFSLDLLNQPDAVGGISLYDFRAWMKDFKMDEAPFQSKVPSVPTLEEHKDLLEEVFAKGIHRSLSYFKSSTLSREDFSTLIDPIQKWESELTALNKTVPFTTWADLRYITKQAVLCQNEENHQQKQYADLFRENSRKQKRFLKLYKEWNGLIQSLASFEPKIAWKQKPVDSEIRLLESLLPQLGGDKNGSPKRSSFLSKRKLDRQWKKFSDLPSSFVQEALLEWKREHEQIKRKSQIIIEFCELGIPDPEKDVNLLYHSIQSFIQNEWEIIESLSAKQRSFLTDSHELLSESSEQLQRIMTLDDDTEILSVLHKIQSDFSEINALQNELKSLDPSVLALMKISERFLDCQAITANSHWSQFRKRFPSFSAFEMNDLHGKAEAILRAQQQESTVIANEILSDVQQRFRKYQELLNTPARKLSETDKELKKRLRKGKSILVKEFAKTRRHPTVRELFASDAREWIQLLIPLWFSNPTQISKAFPLKTDLFDVAVFDEASQIPLQNGLGALQRVRRGIIAGDSQQMGPTSYFKSGASEITDLLHQASFHWKRSMLTHHYRSLHPALISFSNTHFYQGELTAYPAFNIAYPIHHHLVADGIWENRNNVAEAKQVAASISKALKADESVGIVAFSEEQLSCIRKQLSEKDLQLLHERIDTGTSFFKSLENVQGDECDHLIISFGYGKDAEGNFAMRFGPMNTENGRRRLNVLLTRARKRLDFFSSVSSGDFKLSDNESVDLLRHWFLALQAKNEEQDTIQLPFDADFKTDKNTLILRKPHGHFPLAQELVTFQSVMENRGWTLSYA